MHRLEAFFLSDCVGKVARDCTLLLVQCGRSHQEALVRRDRMVQAVMGIDGSIGHVASMDLGEALDTEGVKAVIAALGVGIYLEAEPAGFDLSRLRYGHIAIEVEDSPLGREVEGQVLELFDTLFRPIRESGLLSSSLVGS